MVGAASGPEQVWLWVQEPKDHSGGMQGLSDTPNSVNKKGMSNVLINLATTKGMKEHHLSGFEIAQLEFHHFH